MRDDANPVYSAVLSSERLDELFDDVRQHCNDVEFLVKGGVQELASDAKLTFAQARRALDGSASVQLRYSNGDVRWCDTLRRVDDGFQLIRIQLPQTDA